MLPAEAKREIIFKYMDLAGMVTIDRNPAPESTKNGLMHTGLYTCLLNDLGILDNKDIEAFYDTVKSCEEAPGNYDRYPAYLGFLRNNDANAHDDYAGVFAASKLANLEFYKDILSHGIKYLFIYNNQRPGVLIDDVNPFKWEWWAFRARFVDHITWYYLGNGKLRILSPLLMGYIALKTVTSKVGSGRLIDYMIVTSLAKDSTLWAKFRKWFLSNPKFIKSVENYFSPRNGISHPIIDLARFVR